MSLDLTGKTFGRWRVLTMVKDVGKTKNRRYIVQCTCPEQPRKVVRGDTLTRGLSKSCGCHRREVSRRQAINLHLFGESGSNSRGANGRFVKKLAASVVA